MSRYARRALLRAAAFVLVVLHPEGVIAAGSPPAPPPSAPQRSTVVPPRLLEDPGATYPRRGLDEGVTERVTVTLIVELDATGRLVRTTLETPQGHGFDEAALEAAQHLRFDPARRGVTPVPARFRYRYV